MELWITWWNVIRLLRPAFSRGQTFFWFALTVAAFCVRRDLLGVTSFVRAFGLKESCYHRMLHFFHSSAVKLELLSQLWLGLIIKLFPVCLIDQRPVLVLDGFKNPKEGRKMPSVKLLHQESESNSKPLYIMGHSFQVFGVLCHVGKYYFCVPVCARVHEGIVLSNRDKRTLIDKANEMLASVCGDLQFVLIADAYYANGKVIRTLRERSSHLVTRVRSNSTAYQPAPVPKVRKRGRPKKYGRKVQLRKRFASSEFQSLPSPVYGERNVTIRYLVLDLLWRPAGELVRFVLVDHPTRGRMILLCTDLGQPAADIILQYSLRFKIEVCFKQAVHSLGTFGYHFWMADMRPLKRRNANQYLHRASEEYRRHVARKMRAYHCYVQIGVIAQGMLQYLAMTKEKLVWDYFGSWIRTIRPGVLPSEMIVSEALKSRLPEFLRLGPVATSWRKFVQKNVDTERSENSGAAA